MRTGDCLTAGDELTAGDDSTAGDLEDEAEGGRGGGVCGDGVGWTVGCEEGCNGMDVVVVVAAAAAAAAAVARRVIINGRGCRGVGAVMDGTACVCD